MSKDYYFPVQRSRPVWREDAALPEGGYWDRYHTVRISEEEFRRLQADGMFPSDEHCWPREEQSA